MRVALAVLAAVLLAPAVQCQSTSVPSRDEVAPASEHLAGDASSGPDSGTDSDPGTPPEMSPGQAPSLEPGPGRGPREEPARWWERRPPDPAALRDDPEGHADLLAEHGLALDLEGGSVSMRGAVLHDRSTLGPYPIEYLVVNEHGKTHESAFLVKAQPSVLDACLRALGLEPGRATMFELKDPLPSEEDIFSGRVSPWWITRSSGPVLEVIVSWTDDAGRSHRASLDSLLIDDRTGEPLAELGWIYTGSRLGKLRQGLEVVDTYMADVHGRVIAIYLDGAGYNLIERNSLDGLDDTLFALHPERMPPRGSVITMTLRDTGRRVEQTERFSPQPIPYPDPDK